MSDRRVGFLWDTERAVVDAYRIADEEVGTTGDQDDLVTAFEQRLSRVSNPSSAKSSLRHGPASGEGLNEVLRTIRTDLLRIEQYWYFVAEQPGGEYQWQDRILPRNTDEIKKLRDRLDHWLEIADNKVLDDEVGRINSILETLGEDINDDEEIQQRWEALKRLLGNDGLEEIFDWVGDHPKQKIRKGEKYQGISWRQAASSTLERELEVIESFGEWDHCYTLSRRGKRVRKALTEVEPSDANLLITWDERHYTNE